MNLSKINTLITVSMLCSGASIFFGGSLLSALGLGIAVFIYYKTRNGIEPNVNDVSQQLIKKRIKSAMILAGIVLVLNLISAYYLYPQLVQQYGDVLNTGTVASGSSSSIWA